MKLRSPIRMIKQLFLNLQIRKKLMLSFALLIALPVTLMAVFYLSNSKYILEKKSSEYTSDILAELQKNIENTASELDAIFTQINNNPEVQELLTRVSLTLSGGGTVPADDGVQMGAILSEAYYGHPNIESVYLIPYDDHALFSAAPKVTAGISEKNLQEIDRNGGGITWLKCSSDAITYGRLIVSLQDVRPLGYLIINLSESELFNLYSQISLYQDNSIFITNKDGVILSHGNKDFLDRQVSQGYRNLIYNPSDVPFSLQNIDGKDYYIACKAINNEEWYLFYQVSAVDFERDFITLTQAFFIITLLILILTLWMSVVLAKSISNPITSLSRTVQQVRNGNFDIRNEYQSKDEVGILSDNFNAMIENTNELIQTIYQKELLKQQAELRFLKFQINPHFLYNTLETINWISRIRGVPEAGEIAKALGDLMREGLRGEDFVKLEDEIKNIENYLLIQQYRYGEKIKTNINIDPSIYEAKTPKFILQPIIENALVHGLDSKIEGGSIRIFGGCDGEDIILTVEDDGVGMPEETRRNLLNENLRKSEGDGKHTHIGILNVHKRLRLYFGPGYGLTVHSEAGVGTVVTVRIPKAGLADPELPEVRPEEELDR